MGWWQKRADKNGCRTDPLMDAWDVVCLYAEDDVCSYCNIPVTLDTVTFDHCIPLSRGGDNRLHNLVSSCYDCNSLKGTMTHIEYLEARLEISWNTLDVRTRGHITGWDR